MGPETAITGPLSNTNITQMGPKSRKNTGRTKTSEEAESCHGNLWNEIQLKGPSREKWTQKKKK